MNCSNELDIRNPAGRQIPVRQKSVPNSTEIYCKHVRFTKRCRYREWMRIILMFPARFFPWESEVKVSRKDNQGRCGFAQGVHKGKVQKQDIYACMQGNTGKNDPAQTKFFAFSLYAIKTGKGSGISGLQDHDRSTVFPGQHCADSSPQTQVRPNTNRQVLNVQSECCSQCQTDAYRHTQLFWNGSLVTLLVLIHSRNTPSS